MVLRLLENTVATPLHPTDLAEQRRLEVAASLVRARRATLGQFFTPQPTARLIASMLTDFKGRHVRLLDPGAGVGSLTAAAVEHFAGEGIRQLDVVAWEIDEALHPALIGTLDDCEAWAADRGLSVHWELRGGDYIEASAAALAGELGTELEQFDAIIVNPPYRKVRAGSAERLALERTGLPITNLYTAFLALAAAQLKPGGVLAAITPRSFTNGRYHSAFRRFFFDRIGIERLHLFESRNRIFGDSDVLQENMILSGRRGARPRTVCLSFSHAADDVPRFRNVPMCEIVRPGDPNLFLRIPTREQDTEIAEAMVALPASLDQLGISVSTGKVVEFRAREYLLMQPRPDSAPLIRSNHIQEGVINWPAQNGRKPNALVIAPESKKLLLPSGMYVLVKRLTAKEESRRVCAAVLMPSDVPGQWIACENHLNVFHCGQNGLPPNLACGLTAYLNSSFVDRYVRQFNGHTQINATDLRHLRYPSVTQLCELAAKIARRDLASQREVDAALRSVLNEAASDLLAA
jgi:adenine-specific DNA-methyltransferase